MVSPGYKEEALSYLLLARQLAKQAGQLIRSQRNSLSIDSKSGTSDLVTTADHASQALIFKALREAYPTHRLIGEEDEQHYGKLDNTPTWVVDAIDGTTNFVHGLNDYAVSIAFVQDTVPTVAVVYNPAADEMFSAVKGYGAFLNDVPIHVSAVHRLDDALVVSEWGYIRGDHEGINRMLMMNERLLQGNVRGVRQLGSGSLDMCYVALGRVHAVYCGVVGDDAWKIWDYGAACLIASEAGASLCTLDGAQFTIESSSMVCASPGILEPLLQLLNKS